MALSIPELFPDQSLLPSCKCFCSDSSAEVWTGNAYSWADSSIFQYPALFSRDRQFFRLLEIVKQNECGHFICRLFSVGLSSAVSYIAISYTWEKEKPSAGCLIVVNRHWIRIQQNVHDLLESLYASGEKLPVFVDAVCIDQSSIHDKNTQVAQMGTIYYNAKEVVVWFGNIQTPLREDLDMLLSEGYARRLGTRTGCCIDIRRLKESHLVKWIATHPYWKRLWIVQEMMLAQDVTFRASATNINWRTLMEWFNLDLLRKGDLPLYMERASNLLRWRQRLTTRNPDRRYSLCILDAFMSFGSQSCYDVRDKLYGLLALLDTKIIPDYKKCAYEVYIETVLAGAQEINAHTHRNLAIVSLKLGWDKANEERAMLVRVWCAKTSNVFDIDVHTQDVSDCVISALGVRVFVNQRRFPCIASLTVGEKGCQICTGAGYITTTRTSAERAD